MTITVNGKETDVYDTIPEGWRELKGAMTAPRGFIWIRQGSLFIKYENGKWQRNPTVKHALCKIYDL